MSKAVVPTDLYGQCCDLSRIVDICDRFGVPVICDSAEAMGAMYQRSEVGGQRAEGKNLNSMLQAPCSMREAEGFIHAGKGAKAAVYSFNGNKIMSTSGGGMLASDVETDAYATSV